jgi:hypothetical protein
LFYGPASCGRNLMGSLQAAAGAVVDLAQAAGKMVAELLLTGP